METLTPNIEVRLEVTQCFRTLTTSTESKDIIATLQTLKSFVDERCDGGITSAQRAEFRRAHFTRTLRLLVSNIQADWMHSLNTEQREELWDGLFLSGPPEQTLLVLMEGIGELRSVVSNQTNIHNVFFFFINNGSLFKLQTQHNFEPLGQHHGKVSPEWSTG